MAEGRLIIFCAPSGAGKTTIVHHLLSVFPLLSFSISATTRPKRPNEEHGRDYYFLSVADFKKRIAQKEFAEYQEVYPDLFYGTLREEIARIWSLNKHVILDIDVKGGLNLKKLYGDSAFAVFVKPPSVEALAQRLRQRNTETEEMLQKRIDKASYELSFNDKFDYCLLNADLAESLPEAERVVKQIIHPKVASV